MATTVTIECRFYCEDCGAPLDCDEGICEREFAVRPCKSCLEKALKEGFVQGEDAGYEKGYRKGKEEASG